VFAIGIGMAARQSWRKAPIEARPAEVGVQPVVPPAVGLPEAERPVASAPAPVPPSAAGRPPVARCALAPLVRVSAAEVAHEPNRIEMATPDPQVRIIWFAQSSEKNGS